MKELLLNKTFFTVLLGANLLAPFFGFCQENWVKNGDLEEYDICPNQSGNLSQCKHWWKYDEAGSPEYANVCAFDSNNSYLYSVPNKAGYQLSHSGTGIIHAAILGITFQSNFIYFGTPPRQFRESFGGSFIKPLDAGIYQIEFFVNFSNYGKTTGTPEGRVYTNAFDMLLLNDSLEIYNTVAPYIDISKVIKLNKSNELINDTINWVKLSTCFKTNGDERFFAIGVFRDTSEIEVIYTGYSNSNQYLSSYFFDDFKVTKCDTCCFGEFPYDDHLTIFSNPGTAQKPTTFEILLNPNTSASLDLYDYAGRLVARNVFSELLNTYTLPPLAEGVYHYVFSSSGGAKENGKVVVLE